MKKEYLNFDETLLEKEGSVSEIARVYEKRLKLEEVIDEGYPIKNLVLLLNDIQRHPKPKARRNNKGQKSLRLRVCTWFIENKLAYYKDTKQK